MMVRWVFVYTEPVIQIVVYQVNQQLQKNQFLRLASNCMFFIYFINIFCDIYFILYLNWQSDKSHFDNFVGTIATVQKETSWNL
jgi:hypothetical protein